MSAELLNEALSHYRTAQNCEKQCDYRKALAFYELSLTVYKDSLEDEEIDDKVRATIQSKIATLEEKLDEFVVHKGLCKVNRPESQKTAPSPEDIPGSSQKPDQQRQLMSKESIAKRVKEFDRLINLATDSEKDYDYVRAISIYAIAREQEAFAFKTDQSIPPEEQVEMKRRIDFCNKKLAGFSADKYVEEEEAKPSSSNLAPSKPVPQRQSCGERSDDGIDIVAELQKEVNKEPSTLTFKDVNGYEEVKDELYMSTVLSQTKLKHRLKGNKRPNKSFLFYGPPGTGKTLLAKATATESGSKLLCLDSSLLLSSYMAESEKRIAQTYQFVTELAKTGQKMIIFFDEFDSLARRRTSKDSQYERRITNKLLTVMQELLDSHDNIFLIAATNLPGQLDTGFVRRFDLAFYFPLPNSEERTGMLAAEMSEMFSCLNKEEIRRIVSNTEHYSNSDIKRLVRGAFTATLKDLRKATHFRMVDVDWMGEEGKGMYVPCSPNELGAMKKTFDEIPEGKCIEPEIKYKHFNFGKYRATVKDADIEACIRFQNNDD